MSKNEIKLLMDQSKKGRKSINLPEIGVKKSD